MTTTPDVQAPARNLVSELVAILTKHNHPKPNFWVASLNPDAAHHPDESVRRFQINQFWRGALSEIDLKGEGSTISTRFCLIEDGTTDDWLRLFDQKVAPTIIQYKIGF